MKRTFRECNDLDVDCLDHLTSSVDNKIAVAVSRERVLSNSNSRRNAIHCFGESENVLNYTLSLNIAKRLVYSKQIHQLVVYAFEAGLFKKWKNDERPLNYQLIKTNGNASILKEVSLADGIMIPLILSSLMVVFIFVVELEINECIQWFNWF